MNISRIAVYNGALIFFLFFLTYTNNLFGEYRVYQYIVKSKFDNAENKNASIVLDTLDPVSYVAYHGGSELISVELVRSWMCKGTTSNQKEYCASPYEVYRQSDLLSNVVEPINKGGQ